jgi:hypothetical protein
MMIACTTTQAALDALGHEVARSEGVVDLAREGHERILELEEMYDLDLAWPEYARFYQRLRNRMHLEEQYSQVRDRVSLLTRFFEIEDRVGQEQRHDAEARQRADDAERRRRDLESFGQRLTFSVGLFALLPATALVLLTLLSVILMGSPWKRPWDLSVFLTLVGCCCFISVVAFVIVLRVRWLRNAIVKLFRRWQDSWREVAS